MKFIIQRVAKASVSVEQKTVGQINQGYMILLGVCETDDFEIADKMITKMLNLRIFEDENGKTNLDIRNVQGKLLIVSQFTLYADCKKGNRPSFIKAGNPQKADEIYKYVIQRCREQLGDDYVSSGIFGAHMEVSLINDGPFTIVLDSDEIIKK